MSSTGRKIAKNLGKSIRKKFESDSQTEQDLQQRVAELNQRLGTTGYFADTADMRSSEGATPAASIGKSTSLCTIGSEPADPVVIDHNEIIALTRDVKNFSDTLAKMKLLFIEGLEAGDDARTVLPESLGEVLAVLKGTLQRYPALQSPEIFTAARALITKIKSHEQEELQLDDEDLQVYLDAIDQVALAFSRSVSEYLMGDMVMQQQLNSDSKVKSCDNLVKATQDEEHAVEQKEPKKTFTPTELDDVLLGLEAGLDLALQRAKVWSRYTRDIITYIEKKSQLEMEYAKSLARIANTMQPVLTSDGFLPLQSVFCTALSQDADFASNLHASQVLLHTDKFLEPLTTRRNEHDRVRKNVKETWERDLRRMQDTVNNLRKAQSQYITRQQELERVRETLQKADGEKIEKRKKSEEEALHKSAEAETTYKACVAEANHRQRSLEKLKVDLLGKVREQIYKCDQVIKSVTVEYFSLLHTVWSPVPVQYQTLSESSSGYEAGCQYAEFIKRLPLSASKPCRTDEFIFEPYFSGQKAGETRKISVHSNGSSGEHTHSNEGSPLASPRRDKYRIPVKAWGQSCGPLVSAIGGSDTDSASGSNKSHESSPSSSPHDLLRRQIVSSQSLEELTEEDAERVSGSSAQQKRSQMKRTVTVGGDDSLELPGLNTNHGRRHTMFGVDFQEQVERYKSQVPPIITKCLAEIERRGVMIKGIYRVSGVKSKVENLCQRFDINPELVVLEEVHPNIISNVLKLYLRQLPEPLLTFRLYSDFIHMAKENMAGYLLGDKMVNCLIALVQKLPPSNFRTCAVLMHHLHRVASHSDLNQMSSSNLGIVFGPTLLRPLEGTASLASLVDTPHQTRAIELLIANAEAVFGPGEDYQLVPDQTPVEALEETDADADIAELSGSSEPSPEKSPVKDKNESFLMPAPLSSTSTNASLAGSAQITTAFSTLSQVDDSSVLITDVLCTSSSLEPSAADYSLPGSAGPDKHHVLLDSSSGALVEGVGMNSDSEESSFSAFDDDDDLAEVLLPDESGAQSHSPFLTPHCIADSKGMVIDQPVIELGLKEVAPVLADMDPAPDTILLAPQPVAAVMDCTSWPGLAGQGSVSVPASPTIKPLSAASSSSLSVLDGRISPTKGDSRAERFKLEQRKLLSAIKSDPKLGIVGEEQKEPEEAESVASLMTAHLSSSNKEESSPASLIDDNAHLSKPDDSLMITKHQLSDECRSRNGAVASGIFLSENRTEQTIDNVDSLLTGTNETNVENQKVELGITLQASVGPTSTTPSADQIGTPSPLRSARLSKQTSSKNIASALNKTLHSAASSGQHCISGSSSPVTAISRPVMSKIVPISTSSSTVLRSAIQTPPSATLTRSASGPLTGAGHKQMFTRGTGQHSFESSLRSYSGLKTTTQPVSTTAPVAAGLASRPRRIPGERGTCSIRDSGQGPQGKASTIKPGTGNRSAAVSSRHATSGVGSLKTKTSSGVPGSNSTSKSNVAGTNVTVTPGMSGFGAASKMNAGTEGSALVSSTAASCKIPEKFQASKTIESNRPAAGSKDLSSDRTPRFV